MEKVTFLVDGIFECGEGLKTVEHTLEIPTFKKSQTQLSSLRNSSDPLKDIDQDLYNKSISISIKSQIMNWVDENINFLEEIPNMALCLDYRIEKIHKDSKRNPSKELSILPHLSFFSQDLKISRKERSLEIKIKNLLLESIENPGNIDKLFFDLQAVYEKIRESIEKLPVDDQISILFSSVNVAYTASSEAYKSITKKLQGEISEKSLEQ